MNLPTVSIIIATFNRQRYLREALSSALNQNYPNFEVVVIDDGSTDSTPVVIEELMKENLKYIKKEHSGCWDTKNQGILVAKNEFLLFLDSDDFISEDYLMKSIHEIKKHPGFDYYYPTKLEVVDESGLSLNRIWRYVDYRENGITKILQLFINSTIGAIPHAGAFIRKSVFEKNGLYDASLYNFGDTAYIIKNVYNIRFKLINGIETYYNRLHNDKLCTNLHHRTRVICDLLDFIFTTYNPNDFLPREILAANDQKINLQYYVSVFMKYAESIPDHQDVFREYAAKYLRKLRDI
ncbi:MAG: glycosyltransferase [Candidatus Cloacimonetes bacterium]|nr:glycosyltransferase [Candidatus Cloacimonadota bacterium]